MRRASASPFIRRYPPGHYYSPIPDPAEVRRHYATFALPELSPGVLVHFHDILWPFEYPESWLREGRAWNEAFFLRAFLQYNAAFEITYFNAFMGARHRPLLERLMPLCLRDTGGSLWLTRRR